MHKKLHFYFSDPKKNTEKFERIHKIKDFVFEFYEHYIYSKVAAHGVGFSEACYPLYLSLTFHLLRNHFDSIDRNLHKENKRKDSTWCFKIIDRDLRIIEDRRTAEIEEFIFKYYKLKKLPGPEKTKMTRQEIVVDFGAAFIECCDELIEKFGPDTMGLMFCGFLESTFFCLCMFISDKKAQDQLEVLVKRIEKDIWESIQEYEKNRLSLLVSEN